MKKFLAIGLIMVTIGTLTGCGNTVARSFGGTMTLELEPNQKLEAITWKDEELWYLTRPMREGEEAETWKFQEKTNLGVIEGTVIIKESK